MVKLRLKRQGRTHAPYYYVVAADSRSPRDGKFLERLGNYDPLKQPAKVEIDHAIALKWLLTGAQPTETVHAILSKEGILLKFHLLKKGKSEEEVEQAYQVWLAESNKRKELEISKVNDAKTKAKNAALAAEKEKRAKTEAKIASKNAAPTPTE